MEKEFITRNENHNLNNNLLILMEYKSCGNHVFADYINFYGDENELGTYIFNLMIQAIEKTSMKIVHKKLCILKEEDNTPPGFTSVLLLDESHFTSHCYSQKGLLCFDIFTCGGTDTMKIMDEVNDILINKFSDIKCTYLQNHKRFNY